MAAHYEVDSPNGVSHLIVGDGPCATCGDSVAAHFTCPVCDASFREPCYVDGVEMNLSHRERRLLHARRLREADR